jgi:CubicO group peptidase (beta-lactamase class C family)
MIFPFAKALQGPMDWLTETTAVQCCRRKVAKLAVRRSLPMPDKLEHTAEWLAGISARGAFNGTVLIAQHGEICFERHYGFTDIDGRTALSGGCSFSLASVSKNFTAAAILLLAHRGKLTLQDTVAQHIPELADYDDITITHLLQHTSGVPDHMELAADHWDATRILTAKDVIAVFAGHRPALYFDPGDQFEYSNTGYALLEEIVTRVSGRPYPQFMAEEIFQPLGMHDSAAFNLASKECPLRSRVFGFRKRFACFGKKVRSDLNFLDGVYGDGGIYASAEDLVRWDAALRDGALMPVDFYAQAYVPGRLNEGDRTPYGFGWGIESPDVVAHAGAWQGFTTHVRRDLKKHTLLVMLSNQGPSACADAISGELCLLVENLW